MTITYQPTVALPEDETEVHWLDQFPEASFEDRLTLSSASSVPLPFDDVVYLWWPSTTGIKEIEDAIRLVRELLEQHAQHDLPQHSLRLQEIKERYSLSWSEVAALFGVSRRAMHKWVSGSPMSNANHERLSRLSSRLSAVQGDTPGLRRSNLLSPTAEGELPLYSELTHEASAHSRVGIPPLRDRMVSHEAGALHREQRTIEEESVPLEDIDGSGF